MMVEPKYRTFWPRFSAGFVDGLVFIPVTAVNFVAFSDRVPIWLRSIWYVVASFCFLAYVVVMHARYGQTLGKMATGVKVLDISESKLSRRQAFVREIVPIVITAAEVAYGLPLVISGADPTRPPEPHNLGLQFWLAVSASSGWFAAELVTMLTNPKRRAVHDFIAGSVVVRLLKPALAEHHGAD
jgi:uncharacterized RDD family membrane protein YckC